MESIKKILVMAGMVFCMALFSTGCGKGNKEYSKAIELAGSGQYEESLKHFENAIKENNEKAEYYIAYGMALNGAGRYKDASAEFEKAYQDTDNQISGQNNKKLYFGQAMSYYGTNDYEKAAETCDKALAIDQYSYMDEKLVIMKARASEFIGKTDEALEAYNSLAKEKWTADVYIARAALYEKLGDIKSAAADYESATKASTKCYDAYFALYNIYKNDNGNVFKNSSKMAEDVINKVTGFKAENAAETMQAGRAYYYKGDYSSALESLEKSSKDGCKGAMYYTGMVYMAQKDYSPAIDQFKEYIKAGGDASNGNDNNSVAQNPGLAEAYNQTAGCYIMLGDYKNAESYIKKGLALGMTEASQMLGKNQVVLYERMNKYKKAAKAARRYLKQFPEDKDMAKELIFINTRIQTLKDRG